MKHFWQGFEKRAGMLDFGIKPKVLEALAGIFGKGTSVAHTLSHSLSPSQLQELKNINVMHTVNPAFISEAMRNIQVTHHLDPATVEAFKGALSHGAAEAKAATTIKPSEIILPALVGSIALGAGTMIGKRLGSSVGKGITGVEQAVLKDRSEEEDKGSKKSKSK